MVLTAIVTSATTRVVAMASPLPHIAAITPMSIKGVARVMVVTKTLMFQDRGARPAALRHLVH